MFTPELVALAEHPEPEKWVVLSPLTWKDERCEIVVPRGFVTDLASIPAPFRPFFKRNGKSRKAAILHDWCYAVALPSPVNRERVMTREEADALFRDALAVCGVWPPARPLYWSGVRLGGWRAWQKRKPGELMFDLPDSLLESLPRVA